MLQIFFNPIQDPTKHFLGGFHTRIYIWFISLYNSESQRKFILYFNISNIIFHHFSERLLKSLLLPPRGSFVIVKKKVCEIMC